MALNNLPPPARDRAWGRPIYDYDELAPEPSPPLSGDFQALPRIWRSVLLHPRRATLEAQVAEASWQRICILLALLGLGSGVLDYFAALEAGHATLSIVGSSFINIIIGSIIFAGIWYWFAKRLGGCGQFMP
jgi:Yip1 domain